jgi:hypothetical protein
MIATPAYGGMVHLDYTLSLLELRAAGIDFTLVGMGNESLITRARNALLSSFHARRAFTHLCSSTRTSACRRPASGACSSTDAT